MVLAAHDVGDARVEIIDGDRQVVHRGPVRAGDHRVVQVLVGKLGLAADNVADGRLAVGDAQPDRSGHLGLAAEATV